MCLEAPGRLEFPAPFFLPSQNRVLNSLRRFESCGIYLALIDREIHRGYRMYPCNYVAADLLAGTYVYARHYTEEDRWKFLSYLEERIEHIQLANKDESFLRTKILEMYANPLKNHLKAMEV